MSFLTGRWALRLGVIALVALLCSGRSESQDPDLKPTFGAVKLKAGFEPDPFTKPLIAGGDVLTDKGNLKAWVAKPPDFQLEYTAGDFPLTFTVDSKEDTTLLINLPDGKWVANDDGPKGLNPLLKFAKPQSGRYDIWVGTLKKDFEPKATLIITELEVK